MPVTRLRSTSGSSDKFWEVSVKAASHTVRFGRTGTPGQKKTKTFGSPAEAKASAKKLIAAKLQKGYQATAKAKAGVIPKAKAGTKKRPAPGKKLPPADKVALISKRIAPFIGKTCGYFKNHEFHRVLIFDWAKIKAKDKAAFWNQVLGDVEGPDCFPGVVETSSEPLPRGKGYAIHPRWRDERWWPLALTNVELTSRFSDLPQADRLVCLDLSKASDKLPVHAVSLGGSLVQDFEKIASDLTKLNWSVVNKATF